MKNESLKLWRAEYYESLKDWHEDINKVQKKKRREQPVKNI